MKETQGRVIHRRRLELGLTLRGLGEKARCSAAYLCDIEHGYRSPSQKVLVRIAAGLRLKTRLARLLCKKCAGRGFWQGLVFVP